MDAREKQQLIHTLRDLRNAHEGIQEAKSHGESDARLLERHVDLSARTVAVLDSALVTLST